MTFKTTILTGTLAVALAFSSPAQATTPVVESDSDGIVIAVVVFGIAALLGMSIAGTSAGASGAAASRDDTSKGDVLMEF